MRMQLSAIVLVSLAATCVAQQQQGAQPAPEEEKKIRLEGRVVSTAGEPLSKATVRLMPGNIVIMGGPGARGGGPPGSYSASTDAEGNFVIEGVSAGRYNLMAERTGFVTQRYGARSANSPGTPLTLKEGDNLTALTINLLPQAVIAGRVTDRDGDPLQGISVRASRQVYTGGRRDLRTEGTATTDDQGNFRIPNLAPGRYYLIADTRAAGPGVPVNTTPITEKQETANVMTYFPNSLDFRGAAPVDLGPGDERLGINFQMRRERVYSVRGVAVDLTTNAPAAGATLIVVPPDAEVGPGAMSNNVRVAQDGTFEIHNLPSGTHTIHGSANGTISMASGNGIMMMRLAPPTQGRGPSSSATGSVQVTIANGDVNDVGLRLSAGGQIEGTVRIENGTIADLQANTPPPQQPPPGLPPLPSPNAFNVRLMPVEGVSVNGPTSQTKPDGTFQIGNVGAAKYAVTVNLPPQQDLYVKSVRFGGQDITRKPLDLTGGGGGALDIVLAKGAAEATGTVANSNGKAMTGVTVSLWPKTPDLSRSDGGVRIATTDQTGAYRFERLEPGDYFALAWEELPDPGLGQYTEFLQRFTGEASAVKLEENGSSSAQTKLVSRDKIQAELAKLP